MPLTEEKLRKRLKYLYRELDNVVLYPLKEPPLKVFLYVMLSVIQFLGPKLNNNYYIALILLENTPLSIVETRKLDREFGPHYYNDRPQKSKRVYLQGTRKIGCHAHIVLKMCIFYPQYELQEQQRARTQKQRKMKALKYKLRVDPENVAKTV